MSDEFEPAHGTSESGSYTISQDADVAAREQEREG